VLKPEVNGISREGKNARLPAMIAMLILGLGATQARRRPAQPPTHQDTPQGQPAAQEGATRGAMRRRIVALLQDRPEGLSPAQTRELLGSAKDLADTMRAMARDGLLQRRQPGRYCAP
jgi:hypothetical protein